MIFFPLFCCCQDVVRTALTSLAYVDSSSVSNPLTPNGTQTAVTQEVSNLNNITSANKDTIFSFDNCNGNNLSRSTESDVDNNSISTMSQGESVNDDSLKSSNIMASSSHETE